MLIIELDQNCPKLPLLPFFNSIFDALDLFDIMPMDPVLMIPGILIGEGDSWFFI